MMLLGKSKIWDCEKCAVNAVLLYVQVVWWCNNRERGSEKKLLLDSQATALLEWQTL